jgi:hypothetical protein
MDIWSVVQTLEGRTLHTLDPMRSSPFTVETVTHRAVAIRNVRGTRVHISQKKILDCWDKLVEQGKVDLNSDMHVHLRLRGNASYVAAILTCLHNVKAHTKPIVLEYRQTS